MEEKIFSFEIVALSIKRIECLMEEMIYQQILSREAGPEKVNEKFSEALLNVSESLNKHVEALLPTQQTENSGDISVL